MAKEDTSKQKPEDPDQNSKSKLVGQAHKKGFKGISL